MMQTFTRKAVLAAVIALPFLSACAGEDPKTRDEATKIGFSEQSAAELSKMKLTDQELQSISQAKGAKLDDATILAMVKSLHKQDLKFDIGTELQLMTGQGMGATPLKELVEMGAIPRWSNDIRAMKDAAITDVTVVEIAKLRFKDKKELLSGGEYGRLKLAGMSESALLDFARKGGTAQQLQTIELELKLGNSEQAAIKKAGI